MNTSVSNDFFFAMPMHHTNKTRQYVQTILESRESWCACFCISQNKDSKIAIPNFVCSWVSIWERYTDLTSCQNQSTYMDNINKRQSHMSKVHTYLGFTFRSHSLNGHRWPTFKKNDHIHRWCMNRWFRTQALITITYTPSGSGVQAKLHL